MSETNEEQIEFTEQELAWAWPTRVASHDEVPAIFRDAYEATREGVVIRGIVAVDVLERERARRATLDAIRDETEAALRDQIRLAETRALHFKSLAAEESRRPRGHEPEPGAASPGPFASALADLGLD